VDPVVALPVMLVLLLLKGFFSGSEIALVNADRLKLRHAARQGDRGAALVLRTLEHPDRMLATTLVGNSLSTIALTTLGTLTMIGLVGQRIGDVAAFLLFTPLFLVLGEIVPKSVYQQAGERLVTVIIYPLRLFGFVFAPFILTFAFIARGAARLAGGGAGEAALVSREQLEQVVRLAEQSTTAAAFDRGRIRRIISFAHVAAGEAMLPMAEVIAVPAGTTLRAALYVALERDVYRLPVFEGSTSNVVGLLRLNARRELETADLDGPVDALFIPARFVPTSQPLSTVLPELLHREDQMLVVVDEYGSAVGIVTLNDLVYDVLGSGAWSAGAGGPRRAAKPLTDHGDGSLSLDPHLPMVELNELVGAELPTGEATTLAGFLLARLRRLPDAGDELAAGGFRFVIEAVDDRTIQRVRVFPA